MRYYIEQNQDLKEAKGEIPAWIIGKKLGIHEQSVYRLFRSRISDKRRKQILAAIEEIRKERDQDNME